MDLAQRTIDPAKANVENGGRPFACIIARDGEVIAEAVKLVAQTHDPTAHAGLASDARRPAVWPRNRFDDATKEDMMNLVNAAREVIRLSGGLANTGAVGAGAASGEMQTSGGNDAAEDYLKTLPDDVVMKLLSLMTMGKDKNPDLHRIHRDLEDLIHDKSEAIRGMTCKVPLAEYLSRGLMMAEERGMDFDRDF